MRREDFKIHSFQSSDGIHVVVSFGIDGASGMVAVDVFAKFGRHESEMRITLGHGKTSRMKIEADITRAKEQLTRGVLNRDAALRILEGQ
jgi:hypothetical protein